MSHSPAPWVATDIVEDMDPGGHVDGGFYAITVTGPGGEGIAEVYWHGPGLSSDRARANAKLIAAAPDLLAVIHENLRAWDGEEDTVRAEHADLIRRTRALVEAL